MAMPGPSKKTKTLTFLLQQMSCSISNGSVLFSSTYYIMSGSSDQPQGEAESTDNQSGLEANEMVLEGVQGISCIAIADFVGNRLTSVERFDA